MSKKILFLLALPVLTALLLSGCDLLLPAAQPTPSWDQIATAAAQTVEARLTQVAAQATPTPPPPTPTPTSTATSVPPTPLPPTLTVQPSPTARPLPCNAAAFVRDVSVPDGSILAPGAAFTKTWRLQNTGACAWAADYTLVFIRGDSMEAKSAVPLGRAVAPGETIDVSVAMTAPKRPGEYRGYWMLHDPRGLLFGLGDGADRPFWVDLRVREPKRVIALDFADRACDAAWESSAGALPCPGQPGDAGGFVVPLEAPRLENRVENEPALWVHPEATEDGWIRATYPSFRVQEGDRFRAWVGCLEDSPGCRVVFRLGYQKNGGAFHEIARWKESYDGEVTIIDLDLSDLSDQNLRFVLEVLVRGEHPEQANAFWFVPRVDRIDG